MMQGIVCCVAVPHPGRIPGPPEAVFDCSGSIMAFLNPMYDIAGTHALHSSKQVLVAKRLVRW